MIEIIKAKNHILICDEGKVMRFNRPWFSIYNYRNLRNRSLVIGFVGPRGSGKSVGAARTVILDYMLKGKTVWSNMEIGFFNHANGSSAAKKSQSLDRLTLGELDEVYNNGIIYVDEVNLMMEARRSMSQENLMFSYILQQLRKRRLTIIWSAQSEMHCDDRLRFQTDIIISCNDLSITNPKCEIGSLSKWKAYDFSGIVKGKTHGNSKDMLFYEGVESNKPFWNSYSTWEIQDVNANTRKDEQNEEADKYAAELAADFNKGLDRIHSRELWKRFDLINKRGMQILVGQKLSNNYGIIRRGHYYILEEEYEGVAV